MKKIFMLMAVAFVMASCTYTVNYHIDDEEITESNVATAQFEKIYNETPFKIVYSQGDKCSVKVRCRKSVRDKLKIVSDGKTLHISGYNKASDIKGIKDLASFLMNMAFGSNSDDSELITITSPDIIDVSISGTGPFFANDIIDSDSLTVVLRGSGNINFEDIICDGIDVKCLGSGYVDICNLTCVNSTVNLMGPGDIRIVQTNVSNTILKLLGSGDIKLFGDKCVSLDINLAGSGDIDVSGKFERVKQFKAGSGEIKVN